MTIILFRFRFFFIWWYFLRNKEERQTNQPTIVVEKPVLSVSFQQANKQCGLRGKNKELKKYIYFSWTFRDFGKKSKFNFNRIKKFEICEKLKKEILKIVQCLCVCKNFWILIFLIMVRSLWDGYKRIFPDLGQFTFFRDVFYFFATFCHLLGMIWIVIQLWNFCFVSSFGRHVLHFGTPFIIFP